MENKSSKIYGIQVLHAICCTGILIAHSCHYAEVNFSSIEPGFLSYPGRVGMLNYVVIFFVLSGYLTARQIHLGGGTCATHFCSRFWGLYPLYWLSLAVVVLVRLAVYHTVDVSYDFWKSLLILPGEHTFLCTVEWTLQFEIIFYFLVHVFFSVNQRVRKAYPYFVLLVLGFII